MVFVGCNHKQFAALQGPLAAADEVKVIKSAKLNIISLAEDRKGALWMGTRDGKIWQL